MHAVKCVTLLISECILGVSQCGGLSTGDYLHLFVVLVCMCLCERGICINMHTHTHSQIAFFLFVSHSLCAPLSSMPDRLLKIQLNANRASVRLSVCVCAALLQTKTNDPVK